MRAALTVTFLCLAASAAAQEPFCSNDAVRIDAQFEGGRLDDCRFTSEESVELTFRSEDFRVQDAFAWFAFHISAKDTRNVEIKMHFPDAYARFWPKISRNHRDWAPADETTVQRSEVGKSMTLQITADETGTWVAAQELLTQDFYDHWLMQFRAHHEVDTSVIGQSHQGRPIHLATTGDKPEAVVLIGRQHPGEVPGAIAMREFVDVVLGTSELAREFRERYMLVIVPLINPDGVADGHTRHNDGLTDLNRDWGPFTQPETQSFAALLESLAERNIEPRLMLDFHATKQTETMVFYTQMPEDNTDPQRFATNWLTSVDERINGFEFTHDPRAPSGQANTKNYFFSRYGIPAITYEIGDELDRSLIVEHTPAFAEEMMRTMLAAPRAD